MTISARNWAWDVKLVTNKGEPVGKLKPGEKLTLLYLAEMENAEDGYAYPSHETIASATCQSVRTVQDHIRTLQDLRAVTIEKRRGRQGKWLRNVYFLQVPESYREKDPEWLRLQG